ncbi:L,D-transpeptidase catalytic domain [Andreprevotia lacus DSM 23236]|jgi:hypothetical protein|uniref:L,D-transpeptidase catalytic domain n=1 Tax=Andreprevotia lacus DSM 23236 TaxID=1121001 RepID=A0A1W1XHF2_9NEIS|nr:L,D-transpeptidase [Andreprevotia lacus]SMC23389.1 L,D-transpeptidase catalytic domain [Andreprevotia lacus DSM 23236]
MARKIDIDLAAQILTLLADDGGVLRSYPVSTAHNGAGELSGSYRTPRGAHVIRAKIGAGLPLGSALRARRPSGEICTADAHAAAPARDWILTRILWLSGSQPGFNRGGNVDSMRRYIYIHGTPDAEPMGVPASHGCVRMRNADVAELFDLVEVGTSVFIRDEGAANIVYPLAERVLLATALPARCAAAPFSPVPAAPSGWLGEWRPDGMLQAAGRLLPGGNVELRSQIQAGLPLALLASLQQRAAEAGWLSLRLLAPAADVAGWLALGATAVSDPFSQDGADFQAISWRLIAAPGRA